MTDNKAELVEEAKKWHSNYMKSDCRIGDIDEPAHIIHGLLQELSRTPKPSAVDGELIAALKRVEDSLSKSENCKYLAESKIIGRAIEALSQPNADTRMLTEKEEGTLKTALDKSITILDEPEVTVEAEGIDWNLVLKISNSPNVHECFMNFIEDNSGDNGDFLTREIIATYIQANKPVEVSGDAERMQLRLQEKSRLQEALKTRHLDTTTAETYRNIISTISVEFIEFEQQQSQVPTEAVVPVSELREVLKTRAWGGIDTEKIEKLIDKAIQVPVGSKS